MNFVTINSFNLSKNFSMLYLVISTVYNYKIYYDKCWGRAMKGEVSQLHKDGAHNATQDSLKGSSPTSDLFVAGD
jgi:hypothetical protein